MGKQRWLDCAEIFDAWRIVPRILLAGYCLWVVYIVDNVLTWYQGMPAADRGIEASGLAAAIITAVSGFGTWVFKLYVQSGRSWEGRSTNTDAI